MRSLLAYVCWYDVRTQTSVVIPVSTDLNLYAHTHSPISRQEDRLHLYADGFLEQFPHSLHLSFPHLRSSTTHPLNSISNVKRPSFFLYWSFLSPNHTPHPPTPLQFPSSPQLLPLSLHPLCSLFGFAQMAGAAEQGQRGKEKRIRVSQTTHKNRYTQLVQQATAQNKQTGWEGADG